MVKHNEKYYTIGDFVASSPRRQGKLKGITKVEFPWIMLFWAFVFALIYAVLAGSTGKTMIIPIYFFK